MSKRPYAVASAIGKLIDIYWDDPEAFAEDLLNMDPDDWQKAVFHDLAHHTKVSVRSGQGCGKTALEAACILWFMCTRPNCRVVATAPTRQQLNDILWAEVKKWINRSPIVKKLLVYTATRVYMRGRKETWFATAKTATKPENMQGYHEDHMLFLVDEASGVADDIMETILGTLSGWDNKLLLCGNPNRTSGTFYESHHGDRDKYKTHHVNALDSPRTNKENIAMLIKKYGENNNVVRVRVYGEFPEAEPDVLISLELALSATMIDTEAQGFVNIGVDCARFGDDEIVVYPRVGSKVFGPHVFHKLRTTETAGNVKRIGDELTTKYRLNRVNVNIDVGAMGGGVVDDLIEATRGTQTQWSINEINFGGAGDDDCDDMATILYKNALDLFLERQVSIPNDDRTLAQLSTRKYAMTSKGKMKLESKKDYKKRHQESPDRADALVLCLWNAGINSDSIAVLHNTLKSSRDPERQLPTFGSIHSKRF